MSSEFLDYLERDENFTMVSLKMNVHGYGFLTVSPTDKEMLIAQFIDPETVSIPANATYYLPPNEQGWKRAKMIANALLEWINHTKRMTDHK